MNLIMQVCHYVDNVSGGVRNFRGLRVYLIILVNHCGKVYQNNIIKAKTVNVSYNRIMSYAKSVSYTIRYL